MIALPAGVQVWLVAGATDMRKGFDGLAALVQMHLSEDPFSGSSSSFAAVLAIESRFCGGARSLHLAVGDARCCDIDGGTVIDAARTHRLAPAGAHSRAAALGVMIFVCFLWDLRMCRRYGDCYIGVCLAQTRFRTMSRA